MLILKKQLNTLHKNKSKDLRKHLEKFNKIIIDLKNMDEKIEDEDQNIILLDFLLKSDEDIVDTMLWKMEIDNDGCKIFLNVKGNTKEI